MSAESRRTAKKLHVAVGFGDDLFHAGRPWRLEHLDQMMCHYAWQWTPDGVTPAVWP